MPAAVQLEHTYIEINKALAALMGDTGGTYGASAITSLAGTETIPVWDGTPRFITYTNLLTQVSSDIDATYLTEAEATAAYQPLDSDLTAIAGATWTSAGLASVITDETGSGNVVFSTSPTLVTPALGTPSALVLTNATGLPAASVLAGGLGTGNFTVTGDLAVTGTVDGVDIAAFKSAYDTHAASDGSDHTFIDQDVTSGASPTLDGTNITGVPAASILAGTFGTGNYVFDSNVQANDVTLSSTVPILRWSETGVAADSGLWKSSANGTTWKLMARNDADSGGTDAVAITRTGTNVDLFAVTADSTTFSGTVSGITTLTATTLAGTLSTATQNSVTTMTGLVTTGALNSGSITSGFGAIDIGGSALTAGAGTFSGRVRVTGSYDASTGSLAVTGGSGLYVTGVAGTTYDIALATAGGTVGLGVDTSTGSVTIPVGLSATLSTAAQPNVTSLGTLTGLGLSGAITSTSTGNNSFLGTLLVGTATDRGAQPLQVYIASDSNAFSVSRGGSVVEAFALRVDSNSPALLSNSAAIKIGVGNLGASMLGGLTIANTTYLASFTNDVSIASDLTLASGSITSASGAIDFGNETLTTSNAFIASSGGYVDTGTIILGSVGTGATGRIARTTTQGTEIRGIAGSTNDLALMSVAAVPGIYNATGTNDWTLALGAGTITTTGAISGGAGTFTGDLSATGKIQTTRGGGNWELVGSGGDLYLDSGGVDLHRFTAGGDVMIGSSGSPDGTLHVHTASAGAVTVNASGDDLVVEGSSAPGISILSPDADAGRLIFGSPTDNLGAQVYWNYSGSLFTVGTHKVGATNVLKADNNITNLTLSGASGSELATFAGDVTVNGAVLDLTSATTAKLTLTSANGSDNWIGFNNGTTNSRIEGGRVSNGNSFLGFNTEESSSGNVERARIDPSGNFLLGATATSLEAQFYATKTYSNASGNNQGMKGNYVQSVATTGEFSAFATAATATHTSGTVGGLLGIVPTVVVSGAGGATTSAYAGRFAVQNTNASATITNAYGVYVSAFTATGTITNRWGIYQAGASENNYLAGDLRIGTTSGTSHAQEALVVETSGGGTKAVFESADTGNSTIQFANSSTGNSATDGFVIGISNGGSTADLTMREAGAMTFSTAFVERLRIASDAYAIGIGTTDVESWDSSYGVVQFGGSAIMGGNATGEGLLVIGNNYYFDGAYKYRTTDESCQFYLDGDGIFVWRTAASGTIDTAITWSEKMRLDNSGNLVIGNAAIATGATDGFLYIPSMAGAPSGTPTEYTGRSAMVHDTTNNRLYLYDEVSDAWQYTALI